MSLKKYIKRKKVNHYSIKGIQVYEKDPVSQGVSCRSVITKVTELVPAHLLTNIDSIYIGHFDFLKDRDLQAAYENSSIFVTNEQQDEDDMLDDIIHEIAHSVEETYGDLLYSDLKIEREFLSKRKNLWNLISNQPGCPDLLNFINTEYSIDFDEYLYKDLGYPALAMYTANLYYSPYAVTSLREYFANGFEAFFLEDEISRLKSLSPKLFQKLVTLSIDEKG